MREHISSYSTQCFDPLCVNYEQLFELTFSCLINQMVVEYEKSLKSPRAGLTTDKYGNIKLDYEIAVTKK